MESTGRKTMKSPVMKFVAVAVVMVTANVGILHFRSNALACQPWLPLWVYRILGLAPLQIELPRPMFISTPVNIRVNNLRKLSIGERPPFLAPIGTTNIALGKPVTSSDDEPIIGEIEMITDGDKEAADGSYVELGPLQQHVTIDLSAIHEIYDVIVWH